MLTKSERLLSESSVVVLGRLLVSVLTQQQQRQSMLLPDDLDSCSSILLCVAMLGSKGCSGNSVIVDSLGSST